MPSTIAIIAFSHSGTTMVAGILEILGVPMVGPQYDLAKWEDIEVIKALKTGQFADIVAQRNAQHERWGFKFPGAWRYLATLDHCLREPLYLAIWKDAVSVTRRRFRTQDRWLRKIQNTVHQFSDAVDGICASHLPVQMLSYQIAVMQPRQFVEDIARLAGIDAEEDRLDRATRYIQPNSGRRPHRGYPSIGKWL